MPGTALPCLTEAFRDRVTGAVADLEQALLRGAATAGEPVAAVLARAGSFVNATPSSSSQWIAPGASAVSTSTSSRLAVSCEERQTSSACCSGESSGPNAAWIPPCAFEELFAWSEPLVATATRAPERSAETAAARPEAPLPITSTSNGSPPDTWRTLPDCANQTHQEALIDRSSGASPRSPPAWPDGGCACSPFCPAAAAATAGSSSSGTAKSAQALEAAEPCELLDLRGRIVRRPDRRPEALDRLGRDRRVEAERGRERERVHRPVREAERCPRAPAPSRARARGLRARALDRRRPHRAGARCAPHGRAAPRPRAAANRRSERAPSSACSSLSSERAP